MILLILYLFLDLVFLIRLHFSARFLSYTTEREDPWKGKNKRVEEKNNRARSGALNVTKRVSPPDLAQSFFLSGHFVSFVFVFVIVFSLLPGKR